MARRFSRSALSGLFTALVLVALGLNLVLAIYSRRTQTNQLVYPLDLNKAAPLIMMPNTLYTQTFTLSHPNLTAIQLPLLATPSANTNAILTFRITSSLADDPLVAQTPLSDLAHQPLLHLDLSPLSTTKREVVSLEFVLDANPNDQLTLYTAANTALSKPAFKSEFSINGVPQPQNLVFKPQFQHIDTVVDTAAFHWPSELQNIWANLTAPVPPILHTPLAILLLTSVILTGLLLFEFSLHFIPPSLIWISTLLLLLLWLCF